MIKTKSRLVNFKDSLRLYINNLFMQESVFFYTFHKCASTLFSGYVLQNIEGLSHIDYANKVYHGETIDNIVFKKRGFIYGPIRISAIGPEYTNFVEIVSNQNFVQDKTAIFLVRDPRDILVSEYYSFGFTHRTSSVNEIRKIQESQRNEIQGKTVDEYALHSAHRILIQYEKLNMLSKSCNRSVVLKYEDMIVNWDRFVNDLTKYLNIDGSVLSKIYEKSRPLEKEDKTSHRRSGKIGQFRRKLKKQTIQSLNTTLETIFKQFQFNL